MRWRPDAPAPATGAAPGGAGRLGGRLVRGLAQTARLMVGVPDYDAYLAHCRAHHPDTEPMTRAAFHRDRIERRYGTGKGASPRCC